MRYLPNSLTALRIILIPFILYEASRVRYTTALVLFAIASLTDMLDGMVARKFKVTSSTGEWFDPVADKLLMGSVFLYLGIAHLVPIWFVVLVLGRDIGIAIAAGLLFTFTNVRSLPPTIWGKASTVAQTAAVIASLLFSIFPSGATDLISVFALVISTILTVWSALDYSYLGLQKARRPA